MPTNMNWRIRLGDTLTGIVLPIGLVGLLTGMLWVGGVGYYPKIFVWLVALPALLLVAVRPGTLYALSESPVLAAITLFAIYILVSLLWATPEDDIESLIRRPLMVLVMFLAIHEVGIRHPLRFRQLVYLSSVMALVGALYTLGRFALEGMPGRLSGYGALYNPLLVSHVFGFFAALWIGRYLAEERPFAPLPLLAIIVCGALLLATGSRTPLVALAATVLWLVLVLPNRKSAAFVGGAALLGAVAINVWPEILLQRGVSYRPQIWSDALRQIAQHPWFGHGFNSPMAIQLPDFPHPFREPHNLTLSVIYDLGAMGGLMWLGIYGVALTGAWRWRNVPDVAWFSAPVVYGLFAGMTEGGAFLSRPKEHWFLVWIPISDGHRAGATEVR
jgi:O-antigen ligase